MKTIRKFKLVSGFAQKAGLMFVLVSGGLLQNDLLANPEGANVIHGNIGFSGLGTSNLTINQGSQMAIINWQNFSIGAGESTHFNQPASAWALNRVVSNNPTAIYGNLSATGNVMVINTNGIFVGPSGVIDIGGMLTLTTLDVTNEDFLNGGANRFFGDSVNGVVNRGSITSRNGDLALFGGFAHNQGSLSAPMGTVFMAAAGDVLIDPQNGISIRANSAYSGTGVDNQGSITAAAANLQASGNLFSMAINNGGIVRATGGSRQGGRSVLYASGGSRGITNTGAISARNASGTGGSIEVTGGDINNSGTLDASGSVGGSVKVYSDNLVMTDSSVVNVSAAAGGGSVVLDANSTAKIGGRVDVSAIGLTGGQAVISANDVTVTGEVDATGGMGGGRIFVGGGLQGNDSFGIRESSFTSIGSGAKLDASARMGNAGSVVIWSNGDTLFEGEARARALGSVGNGGLIEVSGLENLTVNGSLSATSVNGRAGTVLFDPGTLTIGNTSGTGAIAAGPNVISSQTINNLLQGGTSVLVATQGSTSDIIFADTGLQDERHDAIQWTTSADFGAFAGRNIVVNTHIRNSGAGSINLVSGWTGSEAVIMSLFNGSGFIPPGVNTPSVGGMQIEDIFKVTVESGMFGQNGGSILVGNSGMTRHVEVGSRFGDTNLAGNVIAVIGADTNGESRYAQVGFRDSGQIFSPRMGDLVAARPLDLNGNTATIDNGPVVGIAGMFERDLNGDGVVDGVYGISSIGVLDFNTSNGATVDNVGPSDPTFIPYANHFMDARRGNWWWQQIAAASGDTGPGSLRPENGAGTSTNGANINVIATGSVMVLGGGRHQNSAQIGHGGDSAGSSDDRSLNDTNNANLTNGTFRRWSYNGATGDRTASSIARLMPVYGNINVLAGVNANSVNFNHNGNVTASIIPGLGSVLVRGIQRTSGADTPANPNSGGADAGAASLIGHGGLGQFGEYNGNIQVRAGGSVEVIAGGSTRMAAQIGHSSSGYAYWDPPSNANAQVRFFQTVEDFNDPHLRRGELFTGNVSITHLRADNKNASQIAGGTGNQAIFEGGANELAVFATTPSVPVPALTPGPVAVAALSGSTINGYHGNITVEAVSGSVNLQGYNTPANVFTNKDRRFAMIGHGGTSFEVGDQASGFDPTRNDISVERMQFRAYTTFGNNTVIGNTSFNNLESQSGSLSVTGEFNRGDAFTVNRTLSFMTITGDISVKAGQDINVRAGNDTFDFATIGHGGNALADYETSSFISGNIDVVAGGKLNIIASGQVLALRNLGTPTEARHMRSQAQVGHGGYRSGFMGYFGDITVKTGGDITITGGAYGDSYAKIGHRGSDDIGQVGGNYTRLENFLMDGLSTNITTSVNGTTGTVTYWKPASSNYIATASNLSGGSFTGGDSRTRTFNLTSNTANIKVESGGSVVLNHFASATTRADLVANRTQREDSFSQIGHGGSTIAAVNPHLNPSTYYVNLVGDVRLKAGVDLILEGGDAFGAWSRVGHGITGRDFRVRGAGEMLLSGEIEVDVGRDVSLDGEAVAFVAGAQGRRGVAGDPIYDANLINLVQTTGPEGPTVVTGERSADGLLVARDTGLAIGHGAMSFSSDANVNIAVVGGQVNGINTSSNILVNAGRDVKLVGGNGTSDSVIAIGSGVHSQIGHGAASDNGNDRSLRGFNGDIFVNAQRNVIVKGSNNGYIEFGTAAALNSVGAAAFIGNGGILMDASATGNISVYAANNLQLGQDQRRRAEDVLNLTGAFASIMNFAKIGHVSAENIDSEVVSVGLMDGDIRVVVGNNLDMWGGRTLDHHSDNFRDLAFIGDPNYSGAALNNGVIGAFSQIGHGGPGVDGFLFGNIDVLVGNTLRTHDGTTDVGGTTILGVASPNNYIKIGHGDWLRDGNVGFRGPADGIRQGDITIAVGESAILEHTKVGHLDPALVSTATSISGKTTIAVSRNYPFYGSRELRLDNVSLLGGTGFTNGTYLNVPLVGGSGTGATANVEVSGGAVVSVSLVNPGTGYKNNDTLSAAAGFTGSGSGFSIRLSDAPATLTATGIVAQADAVGRVISEFTAGGTNVVSGSVFTTGFLGSEPLRIFMPERDSNLMATTTRLNSAATFYSGRPLADFPNGTGPLAGGPDEVFLAPDLWWMDPTYTQAAINLGYTNTGSFPTDAAGGGQGGVVAEVKTPGALPNITSLQFGALGSSANAGTYRGSGSSLYTLYYDALEPVAETQLPRPPAPPLPPFQLPGGIGTFPVLYEAFQIQRDGFDAFFGNLPATGSAVDDLPYRAQLSDDLGVPNWFLEEMLDLFGGQRQSGGTRAQSGAVAAGRTGSDDGAPAQPSSAITREDLEAQERQETRASRGNSRLGMSFYIYDPGTNYYSSFRLFGRPAR